MECKDQPKETGCELEQEYVPDEAEEEALLAELSALLEPLDNGLQLPDALRSEVLLHTLPTEEPNKPLWKSRQAISIYSLIGVAALIALLVMPAQQNKSYHSEYVQDGVFEEAEIQIGQADSEAIEHAAPYTAPKAANYKDETDTADDMIRDEYNNIRKEVPAQQEAAEKNLDTAQKKNKQRHIINTKPDSKRPSIAINPPDDVDLNAVPVENSAGVYAFASYYYQEWPKEAEGESVGKTEIRIFDANTNELKVVIPIASPLLDIRIVSGKIVVSTGLLNGTAVDIYNAPLPTSDILVNPPIFASWVFPGNDTAETAVTQNYYYFATQLWSNEGKEDLFYKKISIPLLIDEAPSVQYDTASAVSVPPQVSTAKPPLEEQPGEHLVWITRVDLATGEKRTTGLFSPYIIDYRFSVTEGIVITQQEPYQSYTATLSALFS